MSETTTIGAGRRQAALTLVSLGREHAAKVLAHMEPHEVTALAEAVLHVGAVPHDQVRYSLAELADRMGRLADQAAPTQAWLSETLTSAIGAESAARVIDEVTAPAPFAWADEADLDVLTTVLEGEAAASVAVLVAHVEPARGAALLRRMSPARRAQVASRVAALDSLSTDTIRDLDAVLHAQVGSVAADARATLDGVESLTAVLQKLPRSAAEVVIAQLEEQDPALAARVRAALFTFEDVLTLPKLALQQILTSVRPTSLATALFGAAEDQVEIVFANVTERAAVTLREEVQLATSVRASQVRAARGEIVAAALDLEQQGVFNLGLGAEEDDELDLGETGESPSDASESPSDASESPTKTSDAGETGTTGDGDSADEAPGTGPDTAPDALSTGADEGESISDTQPTGDQPAAEEQA